MSTLKATNLQNASSASVNIALDSSGNATVANNLNVDNDLKFDSGYGSTATAYGVRAWWRGQITNPPTTSDSANISSMTYGGNNDNLLSFTNAMPDANYATIGTCASGVFVNVDSQSTGYAQIRARDYNGSYSGGPAGIIVVR